MRKHIHDGVAGKLLRLKRAGLISDYCVSWLGGGARWTPILRLWSPLGWDLDCVTQKVTQDFDGVVLPTNIIISVDRNPSPISAEYGKISIPPDGSR